jgi:hypothetical protein
MASHPVEQPCHERVDLLRDAGFGESRPEEATGTLELRAVGQLHQCGGLFGPRRGGGEVEMQ